MKRASFTKYLAVAGLLAAGWGSVPAPAQVQGLRVQIPFEFRAAGHVLPAGDYVIRTDAAFQRTVTLRPAAGGRTLQLMSFDLYPQTAVGGGKLVFHRYGSTYFLRQIWSPERPYGYAVAPSRLEREMSESSFRPILTQIRVTNR